MNSNQDPNLDINQIADYADKLSQMGQFLAPSLENQSQKQKSQIFKKA